MLHDVGNNRDCDVDVDHRNNTTQDQDQDSGSQDQDQDFFLSSRHLETKTLVSRTTSLSGTLVMFGKKDR